GRRHGKGWLRSGERSRCSCGDRDKRHRQSRSPRALDGAGSYKRRRSRCGRRDRRGCLNIGCKGDESGSEATEAEETDGFLGQEKENERSKGKGHKEIRGCTRDTRWEETSGDEACDGCQDKESYAQEND